MFYHSALQALAFPHMQVVQPDGRPAVFPPAAAAVVDTAESSVSSSSSTGGADALQPAPASLVCVAFRAGAQPMLEAWAAPFSQQFQGRSGVALYELAIVEGVVSWRLLCMLRFQAGARRLLLQLYACCLGSAGQHWEDAASNARQFLPCCTLCPRYRLCACGPSSSCCCAAVAVAATSMRCPAAT